MSRRPASRALRGAAQRGPRGSAASGGSGGIEVAGWAFQGSALDLDLQNNLAAINQYPTGTGTNQLTITRTTSGYAQSQNGIWTSFSSGQFRRTDKGLLIEEARTNNLLWCRDMTNAAWVKGATMTAALTQTGIDGTGNSATLLTGGAVTATNTVLQTITLGSGADTYSVWLKRITGSGTIEISPDGSTWTGVTLTTSYQQFQVQQTLANPVCGIRITTNGDQVAADFSQLETGAFATSPILTTTVAVTRNADLIAVTNAALTPAVGAVRFVGVLNVADPTPNRHTAWGVGADTANNNRLVQRYVEASTDTSPGATALATGNGAGVSLIAGASIVAGVVGKLAAGWDGSSSSFAAQGAAAITGGNAWNPQVSAFGVGQPGGNGNFFDGYVQRFTVYNYRLSNAQLSALTV